MVKIGNGSGKTYWEAQTAYANGQLAAARLGNGVITRNKIDQRNGRISNITEALAGSVVHEMNFDYDARGNLTSRSKKGEWQESFTYDNRSQLRSLTTGSNTVEYQYDALGNITSRSNVGTYNYDSQGNCAISQGRSSAYFLSSITKNDGEISCFRYDKHGNIVGGMGRKISYSVVGKPTMIENSRAKVQFSYGPDENRYRRLDESEAGRVETIYAQNYELIKRV